MKEAAVQNAFHNQCLLLDKKIWLRSWGELAGHVRWGKMDHKPQRKRYPRISPSEQTNSHSTTSRSDHLSTRQPKDGDRSLPCSPLPPSRANLAGTKSFPMHLLLPEHPQSWEEHPPWTGDAHSSLLSVLGEEPMLPRAPQDFTPQPPL